MGLTFVAGRFTGHITGNLFDCLKARCNAGLVLIYLNQILAGIAGVCFTIRVSLFALPFLGRYRVRVVPQTTFSRLCFILGSRVQRPILG